MGYHNFHGEGLYRGEMLTHRVSYNPHIHIAKNFMALIYALEAKEEEVPYAKVLIEDKDIKLDQVSFSEDEHQMIYDSVKACYPEYDVGKHRLVLMNPNASDLLPQRRWPKENFISLMQKVLERYDDVLVLITGAPNEKEEAEGLREQVGHERCINYAGQLKLLQMPILYSVSTLMVTNDSGPGHFSSITPLKTFVLLVLNTKTLWFTW